MLETLTKLTAVSERGAFDGRGALALWTEMVGSAPVSVQTSAPGLAEAVNPLLTIVSRTLQRCMASLPHAMIWQFSSFTTSLTVVDIAVTSACTSANVAVLD